MCSPMYKCCYYFAINDHDCVHIHINVLLILPRQICVHCINAVNILLCMTITVFIKNVLFFLYIVLLQNAIMVYV